MDSFYAFILEISFVGSLHMEFYKYNVAILKILLLGHFIAGKLPKKGGHIGFLATCVRLL